MEVAWRKDDNGLAARGGTEQNGLVRYNIEAATEEVLRGQSLSDELGRALGGTENTGNMFPNNVSGSLPALRRIDPVVLIRYR